MSCLLDNLIDRFEEFFQLARKNHSYRRLYNHIEAPKELIDRIDLLKTPTTGIKLEEIFRKYRIDLRFGVAKIRNKLYKIILMDLNYSRYERSTGRYVVYILTEINKNQYHVNYVTYNYNRLPTHWNEKQEMMSHEFY